MRRRTRFALVLACAFVLVMALVFLLFRPAAAPSRTPIAWRPQPDYYPVGTVLQGSRVEMSLGLFSGLKPAPMPALLTRLPSPIKKARRSGHRPSLIDVTNPSQGRLLVRSGDDPGGFLAVSRPAGRGEVIVLTQSFW